MRHQTPLICGQAELPVCYITTTWHWHRVGSCVGQDFPWNLIDTLRQQLACNVETPIWHTIPFLSAINGQKQYITHSHTCRNPFARMFTFLFHISKKSICKDIPYESAFGPQILSWETMFLSYIWHIYLRASTYGFAPQLCHEQRIAIVLIC